MSDASPAPDEGHPTAHRPLGRRDDRIHAVPVRAQAFGMWLFLICLGMLFASGMFLYVFLRVAAPAMPELGEYRPLIADWKLFTSTAIVLAASFAIHRCLRAIQHEQREKFRTWLWITNGLALAFLVVQTPAMIQLLSQDIGAGPSLTQVDGPRATRLWSILFVFVLIHAAHVLGGVVYLVVVTLKAYQGFYDHEHFVGVRHAALYWHFLDLVWLVMFGTFLALG